MTKREAQPKDPKKLSKARRRGWRQSVEEWKNYLEVNGVAQVKVVGPARVSFSCPAHDDSTPSAHIYLDKLKFRCYSASCPIKSITDPIYFVQRVSNVSYPDAFEEYKKYFSATEWLKSDDVRFFTEEALRFKRMRMLGETFHEYLCDVFINSHNYSESARDAVKWLVQNRDITDVAAITSLGLFPRTSDLRKWFKGDEEDLKWAFEFLGKFSSPNYVDNIVFMYAKSPHEITAFKLRKPNSNTKSIAIIREETDPLGFFGISNACYENLINREDFKSTVVVEGEFDQIALFKNQVTTATFNEVVICIGGSGHDGLDLLAESGLTKASIVTDADEAGLKLPEDILKKTKDVSCRIFVWPDKLLVPNVKIDPDEAVKLHGYKTVYSALTTKGNYKYPAMWCHEKLQNNLAHVDKEDVVEQQQMAVKIGSLLSNETELRAYCDLVVQDYPLLTVAGIFKEILKDDDTDLGFINRTALWMKRHFHIIYSDNVENKLHLWYKEKRRLVIIQRGMKAGLVTFKTYLPGGSVMEWARDEIGFPDYYPPIYDGPDSKPSAWDYVKRKVEDNVQEAFSSLASEAVEVPAHMLSQGVHLRDVDTPEPSGYIVNGDRIYKLKWNDAGDTLKDVVMLEGPSDAGHVFDLSHRELITASAASGWLTCVQTEKDFWVKPKFGLRESYDIVYDIINSTCEFKFQKTDVQYAALLVFYTYLLDSMQRKVMTHFWGEFASGKSSLLSLLCNSAQLAEFALSYNAATMDSYSLASIFQSVKGTRCMLGLDEANDSGDDRNNKIRAIYAILRGAATKGFSDRMLGTAQQNGARQSIYNAVITASATEIDNDMDHSRFNTIQLVKNPNKANTRVLLMKKYGAALFEELRHSIFVHAISIAPKVAHFYKELPLEYGDGTKHKLDRSLDGLLPLGAIAKALGLDYNAFLIEFCSNRAVEIQNRAVSRDGRELLNILLNSRIKIEMPESGDLRDMSIRSALRTPTLRAAINHSESGVYYDETSRCIGVVWDQTLLSLLNHTKYGRHGANKLRGLAYSTPLHVDPAQAQQSGILARLKGVGLAGSNIYSIFRVDEFIKDIEDSQEHSNQNATIISKPSNEGNPEGLTGMNL